MLEYLSVGVVLKPQGLKGEIKVKPLTDDEKRYDALRSIYLKNQNDQGYRELEITSRRYDKGYVFLKLKDHDTIESVEYLRNQELWIPRRLARILPKDTFFVADLIGCQVRTRTGEILGEITDILETGSNDVYVVGEILLPALKKVVVDVDIPKRLVVVDLTDMEGLLPDED
jgi:16S rRNA processing protein RimM